MSEPAENTAELAQNAPENAPEGQSTEGAKGNREARYRVERNEARAEVELLNQRVTQLMRREAERAVGDLLSEPGDLFDIGGVELEDLIGKDGEVDAAKAVEAAEALLESRPGLSSRVPAVDRTPSGRAVGDDPGSTWADVFTDY